MNTFITPTWVSKDVAVNWMNEIKLVGRFDRSWDDQWRNKPQGAQIGYTVQARLPQRFQVTEGQAFQQQAILNQTVPITLNHQYNVGMSWSTAAATLEVEEVQSRYTKPAGLALANKSDVQAGREVYKTVYMTIGTPGTAITDDGTYTDGIAKLLNVGVPDDYCAVLDPKAHSKLAQANFGLFNPSSQISGIFKKGRFNEGALGVSEWYRDPNMPTHTTGSFTSSTPVVSSANQTGSTLALSGLGTYAFKAGDTFKVVSGTAVNAVNPQSYVDTGDTQEFVITQDVSGSSTVTLNISPSIITSGQLQTVTASPDNNAAVLFTGATGTSSATMTATTSRQSLVFHPAAFAFVMADLDDDLPGAQVGMARDKDAGISMRWVYQYNGQTDQKISRVDILIGVAPILPYFALRAWS